MTHAVALAECAPLVFPDVIFTFVALFFFRFSAYLFAIEELVHTDNKIILNFFLFALPVSLLLDMSNLFNVTRSAILNFEGGARRGRVRGGKKSFNCPH